MHLLGKAMRVSFPNHYFFASYEAAGCPHCQVFRDGDVLGRRQVARARIRMIARKQMCLSLYCMSSTSQLTR